jgi:AraC family transcriptional regulator
MIALLSDGNPCVVRSILSGKNHTVQYAQIGSPTFGATLDSLFKQEDLELVIIECHTKMKSCLSLISSVKKRRMDVPVVFISSGDKDGMIVDAFRRGARDCFKLPIDVPHFRERVQVICSFKKERRERRVPLIGPEHSAVQSHRVLSDLPESIIKALNYIEDHLCDRNLSISRLARIAGMSPFHFCRKFKKHMEHAPMRFIIAMRVEQAKNLLKYHSHQMSVSQIAHALGFYDSSNLNRHFKRLTGLSPLQYVRSTKPSS